MTQFIIKETQDFNSDRAGDTFEGTLTAAKRQASRNQAFHGTVLKIESAGTGALMASKKPSEKWVNHF